MCIIAEYGDLWRQLVQGLADIPASHRRDLTLWLDHFESLWGVVTQAVPSATAFGTRPDVSLYDHSRATAALSVALWRYHQERDEDPDQVASAMSRRQDWSEDKFMLVQGDLFGIQSFIFATGGETQKRSAKLLRGRSFYVALLAELASLKVLEALSLPGVSRVINAAGKFLIVAPNTERTRSLLENVQREMDQWFLQHTYGGSGVGLAWLPARLLQRFRQRCGKGRRNALPGACLPPLRTTRGSQGTPFRPLRGATAQSRIQGFSVCLPH
jgi:CRISPR-associated protein Csm1